MTPTDLRERRLSLQGELKQARELRAERRADRERSALKLESDDRAVQEADRRVKALEAEARECSVWAAKDWESLFDDESELGFPDAVAAQ